MKVPRLGVLAVVLHEGRALLVRRANPPDAGLWGFPGGKVDWGETVEAAAARELFEETGVRAKPGPVLGTTDAISRDGAGVVLFHYHLVAVLLRYESGTPQAGDDAAETEWVALDEVLARARPMSARVDEVARLALAAG